MMSILFLLITSCIGENLNIGCKWTPLPLTIRGIPEVNMSDLRGIPQGITNVELDLQKEVTCNIGIETETTLPKVVLDNNSFITEVGAHGPYRRASWEGKLSAGAHNMKIHARSSLVFFEHMSECQLLRLDIRCVLDLAPLTTCSTSTASPPPWMALGVPNVGKFQHIPANKDIWQVIHSWQVPVGADIVIARVMSAWPNIRLLLHKGTYSGDAEEMNNRHIIATSNTLSMNYLFRHINADNSEYYITLIGKGCSEYDYSFMFEKHLLSKTFSGLSKDGSNATLFFGDESNLCEGRQFFQEWYQDNAEADKNTLGNMLKIRDIFEVHNFKTMMRIEITVHSLLRVRISHYAGPLGPFRIQIRRMTGGADSNFLRVSTRLPMSEETQELAILLEPGSYGLQLELMNVPLGALHTCRTVQMRLVVAPKSVYNWPRSGCSAETVKVFFEEQVHRPLDSFASRWQDSMILLKHGSSSDSPVTLAQSNQDSGAGDQVTRISTQGDFLTGGLFVAVFSDGVPIGMPIDETDGSFELVKHSQEGTKLQLMYLTFPTEAEDCVPFSLDIAHVPESELDGVVRTSLRTGDDPCATQVPDLPIEVKHHGRDGTLNGLFMPPSGKQQILLPPNSMFHASGSADGHIVIFSHGEKNGHGQLLGSTASELNLTVEVKENFSAVRPGCVLLNLFIYTAEVDALSICPWFDAGIPSEYGNRPNRIDHINELSNILAMGLKSNAGVSIDSPIFVTYEGEYSVKNVKHLDFQQNFRTNVALRIEARLEPDFLPLKITLSHGGDDGDYDVWGVAERKGNHLLYTEAALPQNVKGYRIEFDLWGEHDHMSDLLKYKCAKLSLHVSVTPQISNSQLRREVLDFPELMPLMPISLFRIDTKIQSNLVIGHNYMFHKTDEILIENDKHLNIRIHAEPLDMSERNLFLQIDTEPSQMINSSLLRSFAFSINPGKTKLMFYINSLSYRVPFHVTLAFEDASNPPPSTQETCESETQLAKDNSSFLKFPKGDLSQLEGDFHFGGDHARSAEHMLALDVPSMIYFTVLSWDWIRAPVRIGIMTEAGVWIGDQRGSRSDLIFELSAGQYTILVETVDVADKFNIPCKEFTLQAQLIAVGEVQNMPTSQCNPIFGASFFPMDFNSVYEGTQSFGGVLPLDKPFGAVRQGTGLATDLHDGRKKIHALLPPGAEWIIKVGMQGNSLFTQSLIPRDDPIPIAPLESTKDYRLYRLVPTSYWFAFYRHHRLRSQSACQRVDFHIAASHLSELDRHRSICEAHKYDKTQGSAVLFDEKVHLLGSRLIINHEIDISGAGYHILGMEFSFLHSQATVWADVDGARYDGKTHFAQISLGPSLPPLTAAGVVVVPSSKTNAIISVAFRLSPTVPCGPIKFTHSVVQEGVIFPLPIYPLIPWVDPSFIGVGPTPVMSMSNGFSPEPAPYLDRNPLGPVKLWSWKCPSEDFYKEAINVGGQSYQLVRPEIFTMNEKVDFTDTTVTSDVIPTQPQSISGAGPHPEPTTDGERDNNSSWLGSLFTGYHHGLSPLDLTAHEGDNPGVYKDGFIPVLGGGIASSDRKIPPGIPMVAIIMLLAFLFLLWRTRDWWFPHFLNYMGAKTRRTPVDEDNLDSVVEINSIIKPDSYGSMWVKD